MDDLAKVFGAVAHYFSLLSEPMRLRILHSICQSEKTVTQIVAETGSTQTNISRHLGFLYRAGVLTRRKDGNFTYYGVGDAALTELCRSVCIHVAGRLEADRDDHADLIAIARDLDVAGGGRRDDSRRAPARARRTAAR